MLPPPTTPRKFCEYNCYVNNELNKKYKKYKDIFNIQFYVTAKVVSHFIFSSKKERFSTYLSIYI